MGTNEAEVELRGGEGGTAQRAHREQEPVGACGDHILVSDKHCGTETDYVSCFVTRKSPHSLEVSYSGEKKPVIN
jgi:hypothetical protein